MEREIKFRAWHVGNKQMIYPYARSFNDILSSGDLLNRFDSEFLMQFTGLKDCNGKEIYEGDILDNHFKVEWNQLHNGFALFNKKGYCHQLMADEYNLTGESLPPWQINAEVIGNIYENESLLK